MLRIFFTCFGQPYPVNRIQSMADDQKIFEIEEIRAHHVTTDCFLVKWKGFPEEDNTWEARKNILGPNAIPNFEKIRKWTWQFQLGSRAPGFSSLTALWKDFDTKTSMSVEEAYTNWLQGEETESEAEFSIGQHGYILDMNRLIQTNVKSMRSRQLRRIAQ